MTTPKRPYRLLANLSVLALLVSAGTRLAAQSPAPESPRTPMVEAAVAAPAFAFELGRSSQDEGETHSLYTLKATQGRDSKLTGQKIRLLIEDRTAQDSTTRQLSLSTGKHKTVATLCDNLREIFRKYQVLGSNAAGQELGKIGDIRYGGEIRFVAESPEHLRYDLQTEGEANHSVQFTPGEVAVLAALFGQTQAAGGR